MSFTMIYALDRCCAHKVAVLCCSVSRAGPSLRSMLHDKVIVAIV